jgi:hypothetical protein
MAGRARGSAHEVDMSETHVLTMRDGQVTEPARTPR